MYVRTCLLLLFLMLPSYRPLHAWGPGYVTFTFDDGYESVFRLAYPLMERYGYVGVVFPIVGRIGGVYQGRRLMSYDMLRELQWHGWEIGSHTVSHRHLDMLSQDEIRYELWESKRILEDKGFHVYALSYPGGAYDVRVLASASEYYFFGRTLKEGINRLEPSLELRAVVFQDDDYQYVERWIHKTAEEGKWLIIVLHGVLNDNEPPLPSVHGWNHMWAFIKILQAIKDTGLEVLTFAEAYQKYTTTGRYGPTPRVNREIKATRMRLDEPLSLNEMRYTIFYRVLERFHLQDSDNVKFYSY